MFFWHCGISNKVDGSKKDIAGKDVPVLAISEDFISGAERVETIFINESELDDDFVGWGEDSKAMYESD